MSLLLIEEWKRAGGSGLDLAVILLVCIALEALILCFLFRRKKLLRSITAFLAIAFALAAFSLSWPEPAPQPELPVETEALTEGEPGDTVAAFFTAVQKGDYPSAYACLDQYHSLGLEDEPEEEPAQLMADALRESYTFSLRGAAITDGLNARQSVSFTVLNLNALTAELKPDAESWLQMLSKEMPRSRISDEEGHYLPEYSEQAYLYALQNALTHREDYLQTTELELKLRYTTEGWLIVVDQALLDALGGRPAPAEGGQRP